MYQSDLGPALIFTFCVPVNMSTYPDFHFLYIGQNGSPSLKLVNEALSAFSHWTLAFGRSLLANC
jgi:hypothetical protein